MDLPNPQPGQKSIPRLLKGQNVKCEVPSTLISARTIRPVIQTRASG